MLLKKTIVPLAILSLSGLPIQSVVIAAETAGQIQPMSQYSLFENREFGVTVKIDSTQAKDVFNAQIELLTDKDKIQSVLKNVPIELEHSEFDLLIVKLLDGEGNPLVQVPSEITIQSENLRGELEKVLYLTPDAEYRTLQFSTNRSEVQFVTDKVSEFALVYKKNADQAKKDEAVAKQEKLNRIVGIADTSLPIKELEEVVAISIDKPKEKQGESLDKLVAISDETSDKKEAKPELPKLDVDKVVAEKPKDEPKKDEPKKEEPTPPVVVAPEPITPTPPSEEPTPEQPKEPEVVEEVSEVGTGTVAEELPVYDFLADHDGDGFTNGTELIFNTDPENPESVPPLPNTNYQRGAFFLNRESAKTFADSHVEGKDRTYVIVEKTDEKGRTYFDIEFSSIFSTDKEDQPNPEQPIQPEAPVSVEDTQGSDNETVPPTQPEAPTPVTEEGNPKQPEGTIEPGTEGESDTNTTAPVDTGESSNAAPSTEVTVESTPNEDHHETQ